MGVKQLLGGGELQLSTQHPRLAAGPIGFERHQPCPGFSVPGHQDGFARMGGVDEPGEMGPGLMNVDGAHAGLPAGKELGPDVDP